jgi:alcohol dehydrogenase class IV
MSDSHSYPSRREKRTIQQLPISERKGHDAIINATYLSDIAAALGAWSCKRVVLVHSKALDNSTNVVKKLQEKLVPLIVGTKSGVGAHSPYDHVLEIAALLQDNDADCLISIGSSSYSDACKIARLLQTNLDPSNMTVQAMECLVDQQQGNAENLKDPKVRLILLPTSLSASEWNNVSSATNLQTHKKQHFSSTNAAADLILLDPEVASTAPRKLWLSSGMRAVDHCVETMLNEKCTQDAFHHMEDALATLLKGLKDYKDGESNGNREELLDGIARCQLGSRNAMMGLLLWHIYMGPSHAIGHQIGSVCGVMHGVTSCIMLAPVVRYMYDKSEVQREAQSKVLDVWNKTMNWKEMRLADAIERFVRMLELPYTLRDVGVVSQKDIEKIGKHTMTDALIAKHGLLGTKEDVMKMLDLARG